MWPRLLWWAAAMAAWPAAKWTYKQFQSYFEMTDVRREIADKNEAKRKEREDALDKLTASLEKAGIDGVIRESQHEYVENHLKYEEKE